MMKTYTAKKGEVDRGWFLVDAQDKILGRLAAKVAPILMGKHRPVYTPHVDTGEFVLVINAEKIRLTGDKMQQEYHQHYTKYPGGRRIVPVAEVLAKHPERLIEEAVRRMLPKNKLGMKMLTKLKVYAGPNHPHQAQQAKPLAI
jgi:large subunit ribosomal protein L13